LITENVITALANFAPADEAENVGWLYEILDQLRPLSPDLRSPVISAILGLIERHPEAELGAPAPLVHELEAIPSAADTGAQRDRRVQSAGTGQEQTPVAPSLHLDPWGTCRSEKSIYLQAAVAVHRLSS